MGLLGRENRGGKGIKEGSSSGGSRMLKISSWWRRLLKMSTRWLLLQEPTLMRRRLKKYFQSKERFILLGMEDGIEEAFGFLTGMGACLKSVHTKPQLNTGDCVKACSGLLLRIASAH